VAAFRVALSSDFRNPDGSPTYPTFDLSPLISDPSIEIGYVAAEGGVMPGSALADYDALILLVPRFSRQSIPANRRLGLVARFGVGFDNVDLDACNQAGIAVVTTPDGIRRPLAVAIITFILALTSKLMVKDRLTRQGPDGFNQRASHMGVGLVGRVLGSVGIGNIGAEMFRLAKPFDMRYIAHDPYASAEVAKELGVELVDLETVFRISDIVTLNCPLTAETRHIVNARTLRLMKPSAYLINTARGPVVDQVALTDALEKGLIAGAGLDVFDTEPPPADEPILRLDNVIVAPHSLCWTDQCFAGTGAADIKAVLDFRQGVVPASVVNRAVLATNVWMQRLTAQQNSSAKSG
jgi:phosphoglycerate dehydrogenase-like enzyme